MYVTSIHKIVNDFEELLLGGEEEDQFLSSTTNTSTVGVSSLEELDGNNELLSIMDYIPREDAIDDSSFLFGNLDFNSENIYASGIDPIINLPPNDDDSANNLLFNNFNFQFSTLATQPEQVRNNEDESELIFPKQLTLPTGNIVTCNNIEEYKLFKVMCKDRETGNFIPIVQDIRPPPPSLLKRIEEKRRELSNRNTQHSQPSQNRDSNHIIQGGVSKPKKMKKKREKIIGTVVQEKDFFGNQTV